MANSKLISHTNISNNKNSPRNKPIDRITPHCIVGQWSAKTGCDYFANAEAMAKKAKAAGFDTYIWTKDR